MERRMRELLMAALQELWLDDEGGIEFAGTFVHTSALAKFLQENYSEHVTDHLADMYAIWRISDAVRILNARGRAGGPLSEILTEDERTAIGNEFVRWWDAVPKAYEYYFPLPQVHDLELPIQFGSDVELRSEAWDRGDVPSGGLFGLSGTGAFFNALAPAGHEVRYATLCVRADGIALHDDPHESATNRAIHKAKVCLQLAHATGLLKRTYSAFGEWRSGRYRQVALDDQRKELFSLPASLTDALRYTVSGKPDIPERAADEDRDRRDVAEAMLLGRWRTTVETAPGLIARVLTRMRYRPLGKNEKSDPEAVQATRIATAASWVFDARADGYTANRIVRVAIALEALFGADEKDLVQRTIESRLLYALGNSVSAREDILKNFKPFYDARSTVVHKGQTQLSGDDMGRLQWAETLMQMALVSEATILTPASPPVRAGAAAQAG